jgi:hypothetical protein
VITEALSFVWLGDLFVDHAHPNVRVKPPPPRPPCYHIELSILGLSITHLYHEPLWSRLLVHRWGQPLALFDCMMRVRGRYRWVAVLDFDEYIIPKQASSIGQLLQETHSSKGHCSTQFTVPGRVVCSGCKHQYHMFPGEQQTAYAEDRLPLSEQPRPNLTLACLQPAVGFHHILWSTVTADFPDHMKSVVDPMAVTVPGIHSSSVKTYKNCSGTMQLTPSQVGARPQLLHANKTIWAAALY